MHSRSPTSSSPWDPWQYASQGAGGSANGCSTFFCTAVRMRRVLLHRTHPLLVRCVPIASHHAFNGNVLEGPDTALGILDTTAHDGRWGRRLGRCEDSRRVPATIALGLPFFPPGCCLRPWAWSSDEFAGQSGRCEGREPSVPLCCADSPSAPTGRSRALAWSPRVHVCALPGWFRRPQRYERLTERLRWLWVSGTTRRIEWSWRSGAKRCCSRFGRFAAGIRIAQAKGSPTRLSSLTSHHVARGIW